LSAIISAGAERVDVNAKSPLKRETTSFVYHVVEGQGYTEIDGERIEWARSDTFCVPSWKPHRLYNSGDEKGYLFSFSDRPLVEKLGMFRRQQETKLVNCQS